MGSTMLAALLRRMKHSLHPARLTSAGVLWRHRQSAHGTPEPAPTRADLLATPKHSRSPHLNAPSSHPQAPPSTLPRWGVPDGFDAPGFLRAAKSNFVLLQQAWDRADLPVLRAMVTDDMLGHVLEQLRERGEQPNHTDVMVLQAELLAVEAVAGAWLAAVDFSGMIREEVTAGAVPFREVWCFTRPSEAAKDWLVARVQALH